MAVFGFVFALHDGEGVHDVADGLAGRGEGAGEGFGLLSPFGLAAEVEVEEGGIQFAPEEEAPLLVPPERRPAPPAVSPRTAPSPRPYRSVQAPAAATSRAAA